MVLYHAISTYHLLNAILISIKNKDENILVCSKWMSDRCSNFKELNKFFKKIIEIDIAYRFIHTEKETSEYFNNKLGNLKNYKEIYVFGSHFSFGMSLVEQNIPFIFCEDGSGLLSREYILKDIDNNDPVKKKYSQLIENYGLYNGKNKNIKQRLCNISAQTSDLRNAKDIVNFNVVKELIELNKKEREKILKFFNVNMKININVNNILLLTQHYVSLNTLTFEEQVLIYQILIDYFFQNENLVIKPHPDDIMYYHKLFPKAEIIREKFPSEFMPFVFNNPPKCVATISSTAIFNLHGVYPQIFELDTNFEKNFKMIHRYYLALNIVKKLDKKIIGVGVNKKLIEQLCKQLKIEQNQYYFSDVIDKTQNIIFIVDETKLMTGENNMLVKSLKDLDQESDIIFINSQNDYCWYDYYHKYLWDNIKPIVLSKKLYGQKEEDFYSDLNEEVIYVYSKNKEVMKVLDELEVEKKLPHTGIEINKISLTPEQERIKMLEGVLAATERRLLYYIEKEKNEKK